MRLLVLVSLTTFLTETVISYLHGVTSVAKAMTINFVGAAASVTLSIPLVLWFGLVGGCLALLLANFARLAVVRVALARVTAAA